ncbi:hypothetical protein [Citreimonas salinaria]|uniref:Protein phosphatase 2C n=1 Tax=Citreimonas salinaria TaxID=321339 RepID=A0A1H3MKE4_9RHOB|nr:hypothetical protein [Citreimonas salinaria]SDY77066.1 hypothetical protein SAMN05444340_11780 [Citreimonas salinaria]
MIPATPVEILHSAPGPAPSDDAFGLLHRPGVLHAWVIDGATSVSERPNKVLSRLSDPGWFARALSDEIRRTLRHGELTDDALARSLSHLRRRFIDRAGPELDHHDFPVAAMTYLRISRHGRRYAIDSLKFADCFHLQGPVAPARIAPGAALPAPLPKASLPATGPLIERMRRRRAAQVRDLASTAITIDPSSAGMGRRRREIAYPGSEIVLGSDGYARLWTEYALQTEEDAIRTTAQVGAARVLHDLRAWERANLGHGKAPKPADDVTVLRLRVNAPYARGTLRSNGATLVWRASPAGRVRAEAIRV